MLFILEKFRLDFITITLLFLLAGSVCNNFPNINPVTAIYGYRNTI